ncbi:hypothetical protein [Ohtaekwangia sp.]|uniref:hypothetical protein n=1 Tax=Ohtaekwangia sp. TaxID=2066019 RepID=UPI002F942419
MKKFLCFILFISIISCSKDDDKNPSTTGVTNVKWSKAFGGSGDDEGLAITNTVDGGSIVAGYSSTADGDVSSYHSGPDNEAYDFWVLKLDASGTKQWSKSFGGSGFDVAFAVITTTDGGYAVAGRSGSDDGDVTDNYGSSDFWIVKLDASGNKQWAKSFGEEAGDEATSIIATSDGGYIVTGTVWNWSGNTDYDIWLLKLNSSGTIEWSKTFAGTSSEEASSAIATADGGYAITGYTKSTDGDFTNTLGGDNMMVIKLDASGNKQWIKTYGGSGDDYGHSIIATADGGYAIAGNTLSTDGDVPGNHGHSDGWVIKLDASGVKQWSKTFGGSADDYANSIVTTSTGQYVVAGYIESTDGDIPKSHGGDTDAFILTLNASGSELTAKTFGGSGRDEINQTIITANGKNILTTGYSNSTDGDISGNHGTSNSWVMDSWVMELDF